MALHKAVLQELAKNGGRVPASLTLASNPL